MNEEARYRSAINDAIGRPLFLDAGLKVWLDDDLVTRRAPEGWVHVRTAREACFLLRTGLVAELSLDNDLNNGDHPSEFGSGYEVVDFLEEQHGAEGRPLWPPNGINLHTANSSARDRMMQAIENLPRNLPVEVEDVTTGSQPKYLVRVLDEPKSPSSGEG
jgi:hypothetical protein